MEESKKDKQKERQKEERKDCNMEIQIEIKSENKEVSSVDWRANRLADKLALHLNPPTLVEKAAEDLVISAKKAAKRKLVTVVFAE